MIAQTSTTCDPTKKSCPQDTGLNAATFSTNFITGAGKDSWTAAAYSTLTYGSQGAEFSISKEGQAPTIQTDFYVFFARVDVKMKAAPGTGIVSSVVFESDDLDEIDWEWLGGNTAQVETNFFGKGNTTAYDRAVYYPVSTPQDEFHTYTVDWNADRINWEIDGTIVRTLSYNDPLTVGGTNYPQTPMRVKMGNWCGGCTGEPEGTVTWAGGNTTFNGDAYVMYVESVQIQNYNPADAYEWSDETGSWQSIKIIKNGNAESASASAASSSVVSTNTKAPTSSISVGHVMNTDAAVSKTLTGNTANPTATGLLTSQLPNSPTHTAFGATGTGSGSASASSSASAQTGAGVSLSVLTPVTLLSVLVGFFML